MCINLWYVSMRTELVILGLVKVHVIRWRLNIQHIALSLRLTWLVHFIFPSPCQTDQIPLISVIRKPESQLVLRRKILNAQALIGFSYFIRCKMMGQLRLVAASEVWIGVDSRQPCFEPHVAFQRWTQAARSLILGRVPFWSSGSLGCRAGGQIVDPRLDWLEIMQMKVERLAKDRCAGRHAGAYDACVHLDQSAWVEHQEFKSKDIKAKTYEV